MASALQCPSCGTKTRLDSQAAGETFSCERCGQALKVPARRGARGSSGPAASGAGRAGPPPTKAPNPGSGAPPAPRRRARPVMTAGGGVAAGGTAVLAPPPIPAPGSGADMGGPVTSRPPGRSQDGDGPRPQLALPLRIGAWLIALPLGLVIVGLPARKLGFLSSQKLLDVIVKRDISRFVPLLIIIALWALVSAVLVTAIVEIARRRRARRGSRRVDDGGGGRRAKRRDGLAGLGPVAVGAPSGASTGGSSAGPTPPPRRRGRPG
jgi:hypothetical protein